jgi:hypothetical protein
MKFRLRSRQQAQQVLARAVLPAPLDFDPTQAGVVLELLDPAGVSLYRAELPGPAFTRGRGGRVFRFVDRPGWSAPPDANGLVKLEFKRSQQTLIVVMKAQVPDLADLLAARAVSWVIRGGLACMGTPRLTCTPIGPRLINCR